MATARQRARSPIAPLLLNLQPRLPELLISDPPSNFPNRTRILGVFPQSGAVLI